MEYVFIALLVVAYATFSLAQVLRELKDTLAASRPQAPIPIDYDRLQDMLTEFLVSQGPRRPEGLRQDDPVVLAINELLSNFSRLLDRLSQAPGGAGTSAAPREASPEGPDTEPVGRVAQAHTFGASPIGDHFDNASYRGARYQALRTGMDHNPSFTIFSRAVTNGKCVRVTASSLRDAARAAYEAGFEEGYKPPHAHLM